MIKIVFFGTPEYTLPIVSTLHKHFRSQSNPNPISAVVTQPPRPTGRKKIITHSAVDHWAHKKKIRKFYDPQEIFKNKIEANIAVLAAYGQIIPKEVLSYFPHGILNVHPSLLPHFRGASPVQATITTNHPVGATIIKLDEKMDHGPIVARFKDELLPDDTTNSLRTRLFERSAEVLKTLIPAYMSGKVTIKKQDHENATFTTLLKKDHGFIDWNLLKSAMEGNETKDVLRIPFVKDFNFLPNAENIERLSRALNPWPGLWTLLPEEDDALQPHALGKRMKIHSMSYRNNHLLLQVVQLEGKEETEWENITKDMSK